ncbi:hypothetical protein [Bosea sp. NBC_00550]|uniref:hypothetical protein n=1 Tax=Bosea sp. NBC_00550 TaxID=2969621 RepID=UPI002231EC69|nr:hypothetical protein [Bosea sp. NBC_00550]UZF93205.1 hypothetical protein NWE53_03035 [Bosea sp. NBC_00550]
MSRTTAIILGLTLAALAGDAGAQQSQQTFRDSSGRVTGRSTTDSQGNQTFYGPDGRTTGRASTDSQGTTTFRDSSGRVTGTTTSPRR